MHSLKAKISENPSNFKLPLYFHYIHLCIPCLVIFIKMLHQKFYQHFSYSVDKHQLYSAKKKEEKKNVNCV